jgi:hypothetical protein
MNLIYQSLAFLFLLNPIAVFSAGFNLGPTHYYVYKGKLFSFVYPSDLLVSEKNRLYGDNCFVLYKESNQDDFDALICKERFSHGTLNEHGFHLANDGRWEVIGAQDTIEGYTTEFAMHKIVEGLASCRFEDNDGIHSAGLCYKAFIKSFPYVFFIEAKGQQLANERIEQYRLITRSLISTDIDALSLFMRKSPPLKAQQPFSFGRTPNH